MELNLDFEKLIKKLDEEEKEELFGFIDDEVAEIKSYLKNFNEESLGALAALLIDPDLDGSFTLSDKYSDMDPVEFIVNYYKCCKIDYTYEDVEGLLDDIESIVNENFDVMGFDIPDIF